MNLKNELFSDYSFLALSANELSGEIKKNIQRKNNKKTAPKDETAGSLESSLRFIEVIRGMLLLLPADTFGATSITNDTAILELPRTTVAGIALNFLTSLIETRNNFFRMILADFNVFTHVNALLMRSQRTR